MVVNVIVLVDLCYTFVSATVRVSLNYLLIGLLLLMPSEVNALPTKVNYFQVCVYVHSTDIEPKSSSSIGAEGRAEKRLWTRGDNAFRFNFFPKNSLALQEETFQPDRTEPARSQILFTGGGSAFAFNFQIPGVAPVEDMETAEAQDASSPGSQRCSQDKKPSSLQEVNSPPELSVQSKAKKKKKKCGKKKASDSTEAQQKPAEGSQGSEETELVSVKGFSFTIIMLGSVSLVELMSKCECVSEHRGAAEQTAGLVHRTAGARNEIPEGHTQTESVWY